ncbi:outer membrane protein assembly factor BamC [Moritella sp. F3]|uniref:outer membrane protein assembly factor BamC n=1 Tax=Moritella sp. F3 TaxID=2718882 RepID=UPI0018E1135B|nr:outer membrane protein assembly factor BamC [Moritella sp. F3]GIC76008.1 outer membrane protein assembly factor BamC [Moritella sp. F1]GIC81547.1 outer membrane protein assembly factor BamC [Moritella sp. F3]
MTMSSTGHRLTNVKRYSVLACAILVSACSGTDTRRQANQDFEYLNQTVKPELVIAEGLDTPLYTKRYDVPELVEGTEDYPVGAAVDVRSPVQILALSPLVRVEEGSENVTVWFNSRSSQDDISAQVWSLLANFLADKKVAIAQLDEVNHTLETDWLINNDTFEEFKEVSDYELKQRYKFTLLTVASKRTVGLQVDLIDHEERLDGTKVDNDLSKGDSRRFAVQMLNLLNIYYEIDRIEGNNKETAEQKASKLKIDFVDQKHPVITLNIPFDDAWKLMPMVFDKVGITVEDEDKLAATMLVSFDEQSDEYWTENKVTPVTLAEDDYRIQVGEINGNTSIAFFGEDKQPLSAEMMSELFISLKDAATALRAEKAEAEK